MLLDVILMTAYSNHVSWPDTLGIPRANAIIRDLIPKEYVNITPSRLREWQRYGDDGSIEKDEQRGGTYFAPSNSSQLAIVEPGLKIKLQVGVDVRGIMGSARTAGNGIMEVTKICPLTSKGKGQLHAELHDTRKQLMVLAGDYPLQGALVV